MFREKRLAHRLSVQLLWKRIWTGKRVFIHFPEDFVESIYGWRGMETGECHGTAYRLEWLDAPAFFRSVLSNAVALTSLFFHHLGRALINAIEVIFLLAWSGSLTQGILWKWYLAFAPFHYPSHFCFIGWTQLNKFLSLLTCPIILLEYDNRAILLFNHHKLKSYEDWLGRFTIKSDIPP